ncbi:hypothetical protein SAMN04489751_0736 [Brevibacterium sandarakinum]|uniref:Uncharacterized protein n=1 Tax=Brevibacterium sandarakinum TaxID=629680 RepID=A0A1H1MRQ0_BRESA|nr:hypothetical protein SAMN04489751_0736 [Brevibacterium sandarakinum]
MWGNLFRLPRLPGNIPHSLVPRTDKARMHPDLFPGATGSQPMHGALMHKSQL